MKQVIQHVRSGKTVVSVLPDPIVGRGQVLVRPVASLISAGTERYVVELARKSLVGKARQRPDQVRRVLQKVRQEGLATTIDQVRAKLDEPMPLGYSSAGVVMACGAGVTSMKPGDRVAIAAPHASVAVIGQNLAARIPDGVAFEQAAYTSVAAIALEGVRLARVTLGERVLVIGLGLIGQITVALLKAQGCRVFGLDPDPKKVALAKELGADAAEVAPNRDRVLAFSDNFGPDAVLITAATESNKPIEFAADVTRPKGRIVLVGVAGLNLPRPPFFQKELEFTVSSSLGPGRSDPQYEEKGIDYPIGFARWTAQRNMLAVLETMAAGRLPVEKFTTHRYAIDQAADAYDLITTGREPFLGIVLTYPEGEQPIRRLELNQPRKVQGISSLGISMIGVGNFARLILLPILSKLGGFQLRGIVSARGMNAEHSGRRMGFAFAATDIAEVMNDASTNAVFIATRHDLHAEQVIAALEAGKHVFVEKPICITAEELQRIDQTVARLGDRCPMIVVGFNRRYAPATAVVRDHFSRAGPLSVSFRFAPGHIPANAWPQDEDVGGGRIVGEACHAIDTCTAIVGSRPIRVFAESVGSVNGVETTDDKVFITLRHQNGSISNISYQSGGDRSGPTERIEVFGGGKTAVIDGWDEVSLWSGGSQTQKRGGKDKGHSNELETFISRCRSGGAWPMPWEEIYAVTWASLAAVQSLREGRAIQSDECAE